MSFIAFKFPGQGSQSVDGQGTVRNCFTKFVTFVIVRLDRTTHAVMLAVLKSRNGLPDQVRQLLIMLLRFWRVKHHPPLTRPRFPC
jgi:hypothetical protein